MKKKRKHSEIEAAPEVEAVEPTSEPVVVPEVEEPAIPEEPAAEEQPAEEITRGNHDQTEQSFTENRRKFKKSKQGFTRVAVDPGKKYFQPESRESWGPNVKGKKFRKEKGKKKRCPNAGGVRIDGSVKSVRLD